MTAAAADRKTTTERGQSAFPETISLPMKAATTIYAGTLVVIDAGCAAPGRVAATLLAVGRAEEQVINSGAAGAKRIMVRRGQFPFTNSTAGDAIAQADVGKVCYIVDDQTVALTSDTGARSVAGRITDVRADGQIEVLIGLGVA